MIAEVCPKCGGTNTAELTREGTWYIRITRKCLDCNENYAFWQDRDPLNK